MPTYPEQAFPIHQWAEEDRPREKFLAQGKQHLSDAELIAILIGSGRKGQSALSVAQNLLRHYNGELPRVARASPIELSKQPGIGKARAIAILAALELGTRKQSEPKREKRQIKSSEDAYKLLRHLLEDLSHEEFWAIFLNRANRVIHHAKISSGGIHGTVVDARIIFKQALEYLASGIILCHNHPSGNKRPSQADLEITRKLTNSAKMLELKVLDHLIITPAGYFSFADEGCL
jgi:DNA repair protein RadC